MVRCADPFGGVSLSKDPDHRVTVEVTMPEIGAEEARVVEWLKRPGEPIRADEPLCTVAWGSQTAEISSPATGLVRLHCVGRGGSVVSGDSLGLIDTAADGVETSLDRGTMPVAIHTNETQFERVQT
jgi:pyruvate/2-oxoglutarate dehydrogenase complex dihydrolipoamide acyltransferase (E2) component